jgi:VanZ family protein
MELKGSPSWGWICFVFAAQAVGSLWIASLFRMDFRTIAVPVMILCAGAIVSGVFHAIRRPGRLGRWQWWVPVFIYALFIFSLSARAYPDAQPIFSTKLFHPVEYLVLGSFISLALLPALKGRGLIAFSSRVFLIGVLFAASDEFHQAFVPGRSCRLTDVLFWDLLGISLAWAAILMARRFVYAPDPAPQGRSGTPRT